MKNLFIFFISCILFSCANHIKDNGIELDLSRKSNKINSSELVDSLHCIHLESMDECLIGDIDQFLKDDTLLFLLDKHQKTIFIFSDSGKFIQKIACIGKGEGEYISSTSFCLDSSKKIVCIHDEIQKKILRYNYNSEYIDQLRFKDEYIIRSIGILPNKNFIFFTPDHMSHGLDGVWEVDHFGNFVKEYTKVNPDCKFVFIPFPYYSNCNGKISFYDCFTNEILSIRDEKLICDYRFNLKQRIPDKYLKNESGVNNEGTGIYYMNNRIAETENFYYLQFQSTKLGKIDVLFEKNTNQLFTSESLWGDLSKSKTPVKIFSYNKHALLAVVWGEDPKLNPELHMLYLKKNSH